MKLYGQLESRRGESLEGDLPDDVSDVSVLIMVGLFCCFDLPRTVSAWIWPRLTSVSFAFFDVDDIVLGVGMEKEGGRMSGELDGFGTVEIVVAAMAWATLALWFALCSCRVMILLGHLWVVVGALSVVDFFGCRR